jgi:hypothetical protein
MRIKFIKDFRSHKAGSVYEASPNEAFGLIDSGQAILTKDITSSDIKTKALDEEQANGKPTQLRTHKFK